MSSKASLNGYLNQTNGYFKEIGEFTVKQECMGTEGGINGRGMGPS